MKLKLTITSNIKMFSHSSFVSIDSLKTEES